MSQIIVPNNALGTLNPLSFTVAGDGSVNFSLANTATWKVRKPDGTNATWSVGLSALSATSATMTYNFAGGDIDALNGNYEVQMGFQITGSSGVHIAGNFDFTVTDPWED